MGNGCQLVVALNLRHPEHVQEIEMRHNRSGRFESRFIDVEVPLSTGSILLKPLVGSRLGIWVAHGEGQFHLPEGESSYDIALKFCTDAYPANPNGSAFNSAGQCSRDGRHLVMMPHLERSILPWQWGVYPRGRKDDVSPWMLAFTAAVDWMQSR